MKKKNTHKFFNDDFVCPSVLFFFNISVIFLKLKWREGLKTTQSVGQRDKNIHSSYIVLLIYFRQGLLSVAKHYLQHAVMSTRKHTEILNTKKRKKKSTHIKFVVCSLFALAFRMSSISFFSFFLFFNFFLTHKQQICTKYKHQPTK